MDFHVCCVFFYGRISVRRDRQVRLPRERLTHHLVDCSGGLAHGFSTKQVPAFPVHQCDEACLSLLAHHSIRFPVATDGTVRCIGRTLFDGVRYDELATMFLRCLFCDAVSHDAVVSEVRTSLKLLAGSAVLRG